MKLFRTLSLEKRNKWVCTVYRDRKKFQGFGTRKVTTVYSLQACKHNLFLE